MSKFDSLDQQTGTLASATTLTNVNIKEASGYSLVVSATVASSSAKTFQDADVNVSTDRITITSHGFVTGRKVAASTSVALPTGLSATDYYVIKVDANTIKLASSLNNALAGTAVDITAAAGGGTHTLTPAALASCSYKLQGSIDDTTFVDLGVSNNVTTTADFIHEKVDPQFNYVRVVWAISAGQVDYVVSTATRK